MVDLGGAVQLAKKRMQDLGSSKCANRAGAGDGSAGSLRMFTAHECSKIRFKICVNEQRHDEGGRVYVNRNKREIEINVS